MNDQHIWRIAKELNICDIGPLVAAVAFEIWNFVSVEHRLQAIIHIRFIFYLQRKRVEIIRLDCGVATPFANALLNFSPLENILTKILLRSWGKVVLKLVKEEI